MTDALTPTVIEPPSGGSVMAIAAHPDDIESWCGGTLARAVDAGAQVRLLLVTSGDKGSPDPDADPAQVATTRESEAREAARVREAMRRAVGSLAGATRASSASSSGSAPTSDDGRR